MRARPSLSLCIPAHGRVRVVALPVVLDADAPPLRCRLWHQLTQQLLAFFDHPLARPFRVDVFDRFVRDFEERVNALRFVEMGVKVSKDIDSALTPSFVSPSLAALS